MQSEHNTRQGERGVGQFLVYSLVGLFFIAAALQWRSKQHTQEITVQGSTYLASNELLRLIDTSVKNSAVHKVKLAEVRHQLQQHPFVKRVSVEHKGIRDVQIVVDERKPIAAMLSPNGSLAFVDEEYVVMPYRVLATAGDVPLVRGLYKQSGVLDSALVKTVVDFLQQCKDEEQGLIYKDISELHINPLYQSCNFVTADGGIKVLFGTMNNADTKLKNLILYYKNAGMLTSAKRPNSIDVRWSGKVIATQG